MGSASSGVDQAWAEWRGRAHTLDILTFKWDEADKTLNTVPSTVNSL